MMTAVRMRVGGPGGAEFIVVGSDPNWICAALTVAGQMVESGLVPEEMARAAVAALRVTHHRDDVSNVSEVDDAVQGLRTPGT